MKYSISNYVAQIESLLANNDPVTAIWATIVLDTLVKTYSNDQILAQAINERNHKAIEVLLLTVLKVNSIFGDFSAEFEKRNLNAGNYEVFLRFLKQTYNLNLKIDTRIINVYC